jgi:hypothetical protein
MHIAIVDRLSVVDAEDEDRLGGMAGAAGCHARLRQRETDGRWCTWCEDRDPVFPYVYARDRQGLAGLTVTWVLLSREAQFKNLYGGVLSARDTKRVAG